MQRFDPHADRETGTRRNPIEMHLVATYSRALLRGGAGYPFEFIQKFIELRNMVIAFQADRHRPKPCSSVVIKRSDAIRYRMIVRVYL